MLSFTWYIAHRVSWLSDMNLAMASVFQSASDRWRENCCWQENGGKNAVWNKKRKNKDRTGAVEHTHGINVSRAGEWRIFLALISCERSQRANEAAVLYVWCGNGTFLSFSTLASKRQTTASEWPKSCQITETGRQTVWADWKRTRRERTLKDPVNWLYLGNHLT